jgi:hypothetical protein
MHETLYSALFRMLRPLVRMLLRNGIAYGAFADMVKQVYVAIADEEFGIVGRKQSDSRISIITGLTRKEVRRMKELDTPQEEIAARQYNRAARIISGWTQDPRFRDSVGMPLHLPLETTEKESQSFDGLVKAFSGDVPTRAALDELLRVGAVTRLPDSRIQLLTHAYVPRGDDAAKMAILGDDVALLIHTIDHNLGQADVAHFQRKVAYDNLPKEAVPRFRALSAQKGQALLEEMDRWLARHDRDRNPGVEGTGRVYAGLGIYYFEEERPHSD